MSVGSGIFLAGVCLALVALYAVTRDRWAWRLVLARGAIAFLGLAVIVGVGVYGYARWEERPRLVNSLGGATLGDSKADVTFKLGAGQLAPRYDVAKIDDYLASEAAKQSPEYAEEARKARAAAVALLAKGEEFLAKNASYQFGNLSVEFKDGFAYTIQHGCKTDGLDATTVNGITCGATGEQIREKFGSSVRVLCSTRKIGDADERRVFDVVELGTRYRLFQNRVDGFTVAKPEDLRDFTKNNWSACR